MPKGWCWCNITDVTSKITDGTHHSPENGLKGDYKYVTAKNIKSSGIVLDNITYVNKEVHDEIYSRCNPEKGDILYIKDGATTGIVAINNLEEPFSLLSSVALIKPLGGIFNEYLLYYLQSSLCYNSVRESMKGVGITRITLKQIEKWEIPLPPQSEQQRIVTEIERWFTLIDQIEQGKADLQTTIKQTKSKILDLAIHGKLVPQYPNDEPASELLKRINPKAEITCDNGQYGKVPEGWVWTTVNNISKSILYGVSESAKSKGKYKLLRITDIQDNQVNWETVPFTDFDDNKVSSYILHDGDIVFARTGATVGKSYLIKGLDQKAIYASYLIRVRTFDLILPEYVKRFFESGYYWEQIELSSVGIGQPNVNGTILGNLSIPLPPLAEQHRIVTKIEELFSSLDNIQKALEV